MQEEWDPRLVTVGTNSATLSHAHSQMARIRFSDAAYGRANLYSQSSRWGAITAPSKPPVDSAWVIDAELTQQRAHPVLDLIADPAHGLEILAGRILKLPVHVAFAWVEGALVTAAHRHNDV